MLRFVRSMRTAAGAIPKTKALARAAAAAGSPSRASGRRGRSGTSSPSCCRPRAAAAERNSGPLSLARLPRRDVDDPPQPGAIGIGPSTDVDLARRRSRATRPAMAKLPPPPASSRRRARTATARRAPAGRGGARGSCHYPRGGEREAARPSTRQKQVAPRRCRRPRRRAAAGRKRAARKPPSRRRRRRAGARERRLRTTTRAGHPSRATVAVSERSAAARAANAQRLSSNVPRPRVHGAAPVLGGRRRRAGESPPIESAKLLRHGTPILCLSAPQLPIASTPHEQRTPPPARRARATRSIAAAAAAPGWRARDASAARAPLLAHRALLVVAEPEAVDLGQRQRRRPPPARPLPRRDRRPRSMAGRRGAAARRADPAASTKPSAKGVRLLLRTRAAAEVREVEGPGRYDRSAGDNGRSQTRLASLAKV